jgi:hypothetical protein
MVEEIIKRCLNDGFLKRQEEGQVYRLSESPAVLGVNGTLHYNRGLHMSVIAKLKHAATDLKLDEIYIVDPAVPFPDDNVYIFGTLPNLHRSMAILGLAAVKGKQVSLLTNHDSTEEKVHKLYEILTAKA